MSAELDGARVLVTGASGFIGRHLVAALASEGAEVHGTSRARQAQVLDGVRWWRCDLTDAAAARDCFSQSRPDYVIHLSSLADGRRDRELVIPTLMSETVAAVNVLDAATAARTRRLILPASLEEPDPGELPSSPYAAAKTATHLYARMYRQLYQAPVVMARIFMAYGPGQPEWKLIPATALRMLRGEKTAIDSPDRSVDWIFISDVITGLIATLCAPSIDGEIVDLGSGTLTSIRAIVESLRRLTDAMGSPDYGVGIARGNEHVRHADIARSAAQIGWSPVVTLDEGLFRTVRALRQMSVDSEG